MAYTIANTKQDGFEQVRSLVKAFDKGKKSFVTTSYNETQLRNDFLNPLLMSFGWDVYNIDGKTQFLRDVIQEESIDVEDESRKKSPDYTLRVQGLRKLFVEAKNPAVDITTSKKAAFQIRRYGWNANLGISILTNFNSLIIYDCRYKPDATEDAIVGRVKVFNYTALLQSFDELYDLISFESASSGQIDDMFSVYERVVQTFDDYFLLQIENWRKNLAQSAIQRNKQLDSEDINFLIQRLLNRIVFLRICEDRTIEKHETLKGIKSYEDLKALFLQSDKKYNSGLFNFIEDNLSLNIELDTQILIKVFSELYYPLSPYDFTVVDTSILSQIYEKFLGSRVVIDEGRKLSIVEDPEVAASNGVIPTPKLIVEHIVNETLTPLIERKGSQQLSLLKIADICCGSGTFLISVYDFLLQATIERFQKENIDDTELIYPLADGGLALSLKAKREVLVQNIYGVDINPYAVEVTEFSLLLKLLEGESAGSVEHFINRYSGKVLPSLSENIKCGNSLVNEKFFEFLPEAIEDNDMLFRIKPFAWEREFPFLKETAGFDAIVGNPPYVRIQKLVQYSPEEIKFYQSEYSGYTVAKKETIDKYYIFIQRSIELINPNGYLGYIIPHKFFIVKGGKALREFIVENSNLSKIIHFGVAQVFPDRSTYTAILIIQKDAKEEFDFKRVRKITPDLLLTDAGYTQYNKGDFNTEPWVFLSKNTSDVFKKIKSASTRPLNSLAEISVGLQTSADKIYIFAPEQETKNTFIFYKNDTRWEVEKGICLPCIYDLSFELFDTIEQNRQIIFPYIIKDGQAEVISEEYFQDNYKLCWAYLNQHKEDLEKRSINGNSPKWYQFGRSQSLTRFHNAPKLIWPVLSTKPTYICDTNNLQFTGGGNGPYYALINQSDYSLLYFMGIMAHPLFERMVQAGASEFRGAYYSHGKQFIENLPIKEINFKDADEIKTYKNIVKTVKNLIATKKQYNKSYGAERTVLRRKIVVLDIELVSLINLIYDITEKEFTTVMNDEMFTSELIVKEG